MLRVALAVLAGLAVAAGALLVQFSFNQVLCGAVAAAC